MANATQPSTPGVWSTTVPNRSPTLVIVSIVFLLVTTGFWIFRQAWRWAHRQRGLDDLMAAGAYTILVIQTVFGGMAVHYGFGKHKQAIQPTLTRALFYFYLYQICYKLIGGFTKLTFCALYLRIFNQKGFNRLVITVSWIVAVGSLAFAFGTIFQCTPVHRAWDRRVQGHCENNAAFWYSHAAFNIFFDIVVFIMPIPLIRTLKLARGQKTGLISIFCLGAFVIAAAVTRMVMLYASAGSTDPTWGSMIALYWTEIEANTSVICCCLPALRVPFLNLWRRARDGTRAGSVGYLRPPRLEPEGIWSGPRQDQVVVANSLSKPQKVFRVDHHSNASGSNDVSMPSYSDSGSDDKWLGRTLHMNDELRRPSQAGSVEAALITPGGYVRSMQFSGEQGKITHVDGAQALPNGLPSKLDLGAIYKTTELHTTTHSVRLESTPESRDASA
ncbi:hypothetical protein LTR17_000678 [Elasticomyces elasticus]|nr:hypothetical protein LTR17_000678 [Elasticomyces elasticus]